MTAYDAGTYQRARAEGTPARHALALARWIVADRLDIDVDRPLTIERDGFTVTLKAEPDDHLDLEDLGYGRFVDGITDWRTEYEQRPEPDAVPNPYRDSRNVSAGRHWYIPGGVGSLADRAGYYHKAGASRSVALDLARESVAAELRHITWDYGPNVLVLTATVSRAGVELGSASVGGIEIAWSDTTRTDGSEYLADVAEDIIPEAIEEAREALERLAIA